MPRVRRPVMTEGSISSKASSCEGRVTICFFAQVDEMKWAMESGVNERGGMPCVEVGKS